MARYKKNYSRTGKSFSGYRDFSNDRKAEDHSEKQCEQDMSEQGKD